MRKIFNYTEEYLKKKDLKNIGGMYICPNCNKPIASLRPFIDFSLFCMSCQKIGNLFDIVRILEEDKKEWNDDNIENYVKELLELDIITEKDIDNALSFYEKNGFDLVPIVKDGKIPIEKDWVNKKHINKEEWMQWLDRGSNIGIKTGKCSNITVVDIDSQNIPEVLEKYVPKTLTQKTKNGIHLFFKYTEDLKKSRISDLKIDLENLGGQVVAHPSIVEGVGRTMSFKDIIEMPSEVKDFILSQTKNWKSSLEKKENWDFKDINISPEEIIKIVGKGGGQHYILMHIGGILRKKYSINQTADILFLINSIFLDPPVEKKDFYNTIMRSLDKYTSYDDEEITKKTLEYLRMVGEATSRDLREALEIKKERIDKALSYLLKEEYILKKGRMFCILKKVDWKETWMGECVEIDFKMPYFHDIAIFRNGDMIVIGGQNKTGKSHIALNIIKRLVKQDIKPYYVCLESGNRFASISQSLGLKEGDYKYAIESDPDNIELEKNSVTIIDWLMPKDYALTDKIFGHLSRQLVKSGGILIVFVQLKTDGSFFACIDEQTEALTENGWKNIQNIKLEDKIACFNPKNEIITYELATKINKFNYNGDMISIEDRYFSQLLTLNHKMLLKYRRQNNKKHIKWWDKEWHFEESKNLGPHGGIKIPLGGRLNSTYSIGKGLASLIGWILTEGSYDKKLKTITISQSNNVNKEKVDSIREILINLKISYTESIKKGRIRFYLKRGSKFKREKIYEIIWNFMDYNKKPSYNLLMLKKEELESLFEGLIGGDGSILLSGNSFQFYQKNKYFVDWFQILCCHLGYRAIIRKYYNTDFYTRKKTKNIIHHVQVFKQNWKEISSNNFGKTVNKIPYKGVVWCPTVSTGAFIARRKNKVFITGNSNMVNMFTSFSCKYLYVDEGDGTNGYFQVEVMRESKNKRKKVVIPCSYNFMTRKLMRKDELEGTNPNNDIIVK